MKISLIISTYNRPDALKLCVKSAISQSTAPDEIIIGDDGSTLETKDMIDSLRLLTQIPIIHVWQEDRGFRLAMMRNKSVAISSGDYIIEIDGDIILHRDFIKDHIALCRPNHYISGGRTYLNRSFSEYLCSEDKLDFPNFMSSKIEYKREYCIRVPLFSKIFASRYRKNRTGLGCNLSFFKKDFAAINGYDERFKGYGYEDSDLESRLKNHGIKKLFAKFSAIAFHLWHNEASMTNLDNNRSMYVQSTQQQKVRCVDGYDKYLKGKIEVAEKDVVVVTADYEGVSDNG